MTETISLTINGRERSVVTEVERPLLDVLREDLQLTGALNMDAVRVVAALARCWSMANAHSPAECRLATRRASLC